MNLDDERIYLNGTLKKTDGTWNIELPLIKCSYQKDKVAECIDEMKEFLKKGIQDPAVSIELKVQDGGIIQITTSDSEAFKSFIDSMVL